MANQVKTLADAIRYFSDEQVCIDTIAGLKWPDGPVCPKCQSKADRQHWLKTQKRWQCRDCGKQFSVKVGTIFEDSAIRLDKWLTAMWLLATCKNGISSYELARDIGVTQKSAWFMLHRLREAMRDTRKHKFGFGGPVESDEAFIGPNPQKMHKDRKAKLQARDGLKGGFVGKTAVHGMLDRELRQVRANVVASVTRRTLQDAILKNVTPFAKVYTDEATCYEGLSKNYVHKIINHSVEYVRGQVHTQGPIFDAETGRVFAFVHGFKDSQIVQRFVDTNSQNVSQGAPAQHVQALHAVYSVGIRLDAIRTELQGFGVTL